MQYTQDRYNVAGEAIGGNVGRSGNHQFAGASNPTSATNFRVRSQSFGLFSGLIMYAVGGAHVVGGDVYQTVRPNRHEPAGAIRSSRLDFRSGDPVNNGASIVHHYVMWYAGAAIV
jgi:hypothetical protein